MAAAGAKEGVADEGARMRLNGETKRVLAFAEKAKQRITDTTADQPWEADPSLWVADLYVNVVTIPYLVIKGIVLFPVFLIVQLPMVAMAYLRASFAPRPCPALNRTHWGHYVWLVFFAVVASPTLLLALLSYAVDMVMYYFFSVIYCTLACNWRNYSKSQAVLECFRGGPSLLANLTDCAATIVSAVDRQTFLKSDLLLASMWITVPWFKYFQNANPFIYPLEHRFLTQISTSLQDLTVPQILDAVYFSTCKLEDKERKLMRKWPFQPVYTQPPSWKRWAVGMQAVGGTPVLGTVSFLMAHVAHAASRAGGLTELFTPSHSAMVQIVRVILWYNNPYHCYTGWVEANISTGAPSQLNKSRGGEHPMWLVGVRSPKHCNRKAAATAAIADASFDKWLPDCVNYMRGLYHDEAYVQSLAEGVVSQDGISPPALGKEVPYVPPYPDVADA